MRDDELSLHYFTYVVASTKGCSISTNLVHEIFIADYVCADGGSCEPGLVFQ